MDTVSQKSAATRLMPFTLGRQQDFFPAPRVMHTDAEK
jgi:hypothetical protein